MTSLYQHEWQEQQSENLSFLSDNTQVEFESRLAEALPQAHTETEILQTVLRCALQMNGQPVETVMPVLYDALLHNPVQKRAALLLADQILKKNML